MIHSRITSAIALAGPAPAGSRAARRGFTLIELLITISIIGIMASMILFAMFQAQQTASEHKTRALIMKLNTIVMRRYDEYRTRRVPYVFPSPTVTNSPQDMQRCSIELARARLDCLRDLMRLEMPDRWSDVTDNPVAPFQHGINTSVLPAYAGTIVRPAVSQAYYDKWSAANTAGNPPTFDNQGAECLYMIVMSALSQEGDSRDFFKASDVGDVDNDGFPEFLDAWNQPIEFIRWPAGFLSELQTPIRLEGDVSQDPSTQSAAVQVTANLGPRLSQTPGSYVGGAIAFLRQNNTQIDFELMGRITGYRYDNTVNPPTVIFTCSTPLVDTDQLPFDGNEPNGEFVVLQPDPFDSRGSYPKYNPTGSTRPTPDTSVPTYAIYPLIISPGPDRAMGVKDGAGGGVVLQYRDEQLNPFYYAPPVATGDNYKLMLGAIPSLDTTTNWYYGCHNDNITNHQLSTR